MEGEERGFETLEFYQDSLKLLKASYRLAGKLPNARTLQFERSIAPSRL